jgi:hypothetical protein
LTNRTASPIFRVRTDTHKEETMSTIPRNHTRRIAEIRETIVAATVHSLDNGFAAEPVDVDAAFRYLEDDRFKSARLREGGTGGTSYSISVHGNLWYNLLTQADLDRHEHLLDLYPEREPKFEQGSTVEIAHGPLALDREGVVHMVTQVQTPDRFRHPNAETVYMVLASEFDREAGWIAESELRAAEPTPFEKLSDSPVLHEPGVGEGDIEVWYYKQEVARDASLAGYGDASWKPDPTNLEATHVHLGTVGWEGNIDYAGGIFTHMQGEVWSPLGEARSLIESKGLTHTSMSIGDVIVIGGVASMCVAVGWRELGPVAKPEPTPEEVAARRLYALIDSLAARNAASLLTRSGGEQVVLVTDEERDDLCDLVRDLVEDPDLFEKADGADITVTDEGTVVAFDIHNATARAWVEDNVETEGWQWLGRNRFAVDHRFAVPLIQGMTQDGLEVAGPAIGPEA